MKNGIIEGCVKVIAKNLRVPETDRDEFVTVVVEEYKTGNLDSLTIGEFITFCQGACKIFSKY